MSLVVDSPDEVLHTPPSHERLRIDNLPGKSTQSSVSRYEGSPEPTKSAPSSGKRKQRAESSSDSQTSTSAKRKKLAKEAAETRDLGLKALPVPEIDSTIAVESKLYNELLAWSKEHNSATESLSNAIVSENQHLKVYSLQRLKFVRSELARCEAKVNEAKLLDIDLKVCF